MRGQPLKTNGEKQAGGSEGKEGVQEHVMAGSGGAGSWRGSHGSGACLLVMSLRAAFFFLP